MITFNAIVQRYGPAYWATPPAPMESMKKSGHEMDCTGNQQHTVVPIGRLKPKPP